MNNSWNNTFLKIALLMAEHSKCMRLKVAAILVKDNKILSTGINGTAPGTENCCQHFKDYDTSSIEFYNEHKKFSENNENHAELNCILFAAKNGVNIENSTMYLTISPCINCAKSILISGIKEVYYITEYDREILGIQYLKKNNIKIQKIKLEDF